ncbi:MAG TPA: hypothetical protein PLK58_09645 [Candidatus Rifleibacterium sp.]|nr:hypothetical protein [Candidatus Rifleibacterium sp.]
MNWLFYCEIIFSGLLAGLITSLVSPAGNPWDLIENFQTGLLATGVFSGLFAGLVSSLPVLVMEKRFSKALTCWISSTSVGLSVTMLGGVIFAMVADFILSQTPIASGILRFFWWLSLSVCLSGCFGILHGSVKIMCRSLMGLTPALIIAGAFVDRIFITDSHNLVAFLLLGAVTGSGFAIAWELLKESWLDEHVSSLVVYRYYIDGPEFTGGSTDECDLTLAEGPENLFVISEKDGIHIIEAHDEEMTLRINQARFRYRVLVDGDTIVVGQRVFIYHSKLARSRDVLPEATI